MRRKIGKLVDGRKRLSKKFLTQGLVKRLKVNLKVIIAFVQVAGNSSSVFGINSYFCSSVSSSRRTISMFCYRSAGDHSSSPSF